MGVLVATGVLLNVILKPVEWLVGHSRLFSIAKGPYYLLPLVIALVAGYIGNLRFKGNHQLWVWVLPALYLAIRMILWKRPGVLDNNSWEAVLTHFFVGRPPYYPEQDVMVPLYTSVAYSIGALLQRSALSRRRHRADRTSRAIDPQG
ncbi:MAG TPA: hypothetical protein VK466_02920 [Terriglobales bacterium]|nr:hypothetical protein [Terriglobales bacterium]